MYTVFVTGPLSRVAVISASIFLNRIITWASVNCALLPSLRMGPQAFLSVGRHGRNRSKCDITGLLLRPVRVGSIQPLSSDCSRVQMYEQLRGPTLWTQTPPQTVLRFHALGQRSANSSECSSWMPTQNSSNRSHLRTQMHSSSEIPSLASDELGSLTETALLTASSTGVSCNLCDP